MNNLLSPWDELQTFESYRPETLRAIALDGLNQPMDGGKKRSRNEWRRWADKKPLLPGEVKAGFVAVVSYWPDTRDFPYFRIAWAGMPYAK